VGRTEEKRDSLAGGNGFSFSSPNIHNHPPSPIASRLSLPLFRALFRSRMVAAVVVVRARALACVCVMFASSRPMPPTPPLTDIYIYYLRTLFNIHAPRYATRFRYCRRFPRKSGTILLFLRRDKSAAGFSRQHSAQRALDNSALNVKR